MVTTTYKGYELQVTGTNSGTWGDIWNTLVFTIIDRNIGDSISVTLAAVPVTLSATEAQYMSVVLTGTLGASVQVTSGAQGFYIVENLATVGAFSVTWTNGAGSPVTLFPNTRYLMFAVAGDGVEVFGFANNVNPVSLPAGTQMLFTNSAVPTGWSLSTALNDYTCWVSNTAGGVASGSVAFSTIVARTTVDTHALTTAQIPAHTHTVTLDAAGDFGLEGPTAEWQADQVVFATNVVATSSTTGSGTGHSHSLDLRAQHVTCIIGIKA